MESVTFANREAWLTALAKEIEPLIRQRCDLHRKPYRIACGWPSRKGTSQNRRRIGECWNQAERSTKEMFISPTLDDPDEVASTVAHELLHAFLPPGVGHRKPFSQAAKKLGMTGAPTECGAGPDLAKTLKEITDRLGPYPHEAIEVEAPKDRCRNLKYMCMECGYIGRSSAYWLDNLGAPICPQCEQQMSQAEGEEAANPLEIVNNVTEMKVPGDDRFRIMRTLHGKKVAWMVIDYEADDSSMFHHVPASQMFSGNLMPCRHTPAESRENALEIIEGIRSGLTTYEMLEESWEGDVEDVEDGLIELPPQLPELDEYLDGDEDPDYPEDQDQIVDLHELPPEVESRRRTALELAKAA